MSANHRVIGRPIEISSSTADIETGEVRQMENMSAALRTEHMRFVAADFQCIEAPIT